MMIPWSKDELRRIAEADDLHISPLRENGVTKEVTFEAIGLSGGITTLTGLERIPVAIRPVPGDDQS
jgi:hypothetical protein